MRRTPFNDGWTVGAKANSFAELIAGAGSAPLQVTLPHDAMIGTERSPAGHAATAYFPSGNWEYKKSFELSPDEAGSAVFLEFDGVYRDALVRVNDTVVAHRPGGYSDFTVQVDHLLRFGEPNEVKVEARAHDDSRWYSGAGIYRSVWLLQGGRVHLVPGGLQLVTPEIDDDVAMVAVSAEVRNQSAGTSNAVLRVEILDADGRCVADGRGTGHDGAGRCPHGPATSLCPGTTPVGSRRSLPLHVPGQLAGRRPGRGRGVDDVRNPDVDGRPPARDCASTGSPSSCVVPVSTTTTARSERPRSIAPRSAGSNSSRRLDSTRSGAPTTP